MGNMKMSRDKQIKSDFGSKHPDFITTLLVCLFNIHIVLGQSMQIGQSVLQTNLTGRLISKMSQSYQDKSYFLACDFKNSELVLLQYVGTQFIERAVSNSSTSLCLGVAFNPLGNQYALFTNDIGSVVLASITNNPPSITNMNSIDLTGYIFREIAWNQQGTHAVALGDRLGYVILRLQSGNIIGEIVRDKQQNSNKFFFQVINLKQNIFLTSILDENIMIIFNIGGSTFQILQNITVNVTKIVEVFLHQSTLFVLLDGDPDLKIFDFDTNFDPTNISLNAIKLQNTKNLNDSQFNNQYKLDNLTSILITRDSTLMHIGFISGISHRFYTYPIQTGRFIIQSQENSL